MKKSVTMSRLARRTLNVNESGIVAKKEDYHSASDFYMNKNVS